MAQQSTTGNPYSGKDQGLASAETDLLILRKGSL